MVKIFSYSIFFYGEDGELYTRNQSPDAFFDATPYQKDDLGLNFYIFTCCVNFPSILNNVLSEESRVDIKLLLDRYFNSLKYLIKAGGITKVKHIYPYLHYPIIWNYRDATINSISEDKSYCHIEYIWSSDTEEYVELFGEALIRRKDYEITISYFQNRKKVTDSVKFSLSLEGLGNFIASYFYDDSSQS